MCANICTFILYVIKHIFKKISYIRLKRAARITADDSKKLTNFINSSILLELRFLRHWQDVRAALRVFCSRRRLSCRHL